MSGGGVGRRASLAAVGVMFLAGAAQVPAQTSGFHAEVEGAGRPVPYPVTPADRFMSAIENGTRTGTGEPGPDYWQQYARYDIDARIDTEARRLEGESRIVYFNNSPGALSTLSVKLYQNLHAEGAARHYPQEVTGGFELHRVAVNGQEIRPGREAPRFAVQGTSMPIWLASPLASGDSAILEIDWSFTIPRAGAAGRMGWNDDNLFYLAYWYPHMAVYDDVVGWHDDRFTGRGEFYAGFADYDVRLDVPAGWVVVGTGTLQNHDAVFPPEIRERIRQAEASDEVVNVLTAEDFGPGSATLAPESGRLMWHLRSDRVRDVAYSITRESLWDAARAPVGDRDGDGATDYTRVDAIYRAEAEKWTEAVRYGQHSIAFLSEYLDFPYPWPHMTAVEGEGIIGGGMEYPMMTLIGGYNRASASALYGTIAHEFGHMWMPMTVSSDEVRWAWMDEGSTSFNDTQASNDYYPDNNGSDAGQYAGMVAQGYDGTMMRWTDWEDPAAWGIAAYPKGAAALGALRAILGDEVFQRAYRAYVDSWAWKHPKPWDLFNTFEAVSGEDLDWFWRGWFYERWKLDHAVASVETGSGRTRITIEDRGSLPMPAMVTVTREGGATEVLTVDVDRWLSGARTATLDVPAGAPVVRVELDAGHDFADVDRDNDVWEASG
jgi:hypothetical protein